MTITATSSPSEDHLHISQPVSLWSGYEGSKTQYLYTMCSLLVQRQSEHTAIKAEYLSLKGSSR